MNATVETNTAETNTNNIVVVEKSPRDKCKRADAIYERELPSQAEKGMKQWRSDVLNMMQQELPCTLAASVAHYNNARIARGGEKKVLGPRKNKTNENASASADNAQQGEAATQPAPSVVWCVEKNDGSKSWYMSEEEARAKAAKMKNVKDVYIDNDVEA